MPSLSHILVSSSHLSINQKSLTSGDLPDFQINRIVEASVLRVLSSRQVELLLHGKKILAKTYIPVKAGETLLLKVLKQGRQQIMKLIEVRRQEPSGKHDGFYRESIQNGAGKGLKSLAGRYPDHLLNNDALVGHIKTLTKGFDRLEFLNKYSCEDPVRYLLPLPFLFDETLKFGQMLLDLGKGKNFKENADTDLIRVSFLLEMSEMGDIRADFSIFKKQIVGSFGVANNDIRSLIEAGVSDLVRNLNKHGFDVHEITCHVVNSEILAATSLNQELTGENQGVLNLFI
jgi:hypothetical protein